MQTVRLSKMAYAKRYDQIADRLYRIALYLLGDAHQARRVMASLFVEGFLAQQQTRFELAMLKTLWRLTKESCPVVGDQYCQNLLNAGRSDMKDSEYVRLLQLLGALPLIERAVLLLVVMQGQPIENVALVLELPPDELGSMHISLCARARKTLAA